MSNSCGVSQFEQVKIPTSREEREKWGTQRISDARLIISFDPEYAPGARQCGERLFAGAAGGTSVRDY